jgi:hypothetical protein
MSYLFFQWGCLDEVREFMHAPARRQAVKNDVWNIGLSRWPRFCNLISRVGIETYFCLLKEIVMRYGMIAVLSAAMMAPVLTGCTTGHEDSTSTNPITGTKTTKDQTTTENPITGESHTTVQKSQTSGITGNTSNSTETH